MRVGTDIIEVERIKKALQDSNFIDRVFFKTEIGYANGFKNSAEHLAGFFSAKESVMKALIDCKEISFKDIEILHSEFGSPYVKLYGKAKSLFDALNAKELQISISQIKDVATAICIII